MRGLPLLSVSFSLAGLRETKQSPWEALSIINGLGCDLDELTLPLACFQVYGLKPELCPLVSSMLSPSIITPHLSCRQHIN